MPTPLIRRRSWWPHECRDPAGPAGHRARRLHPAEPAGTAVAAATESTAPAPSPGGTVSIGIDVGLRGFNPYVSAQWTPAAAAISSMVLPSAFPAGATVDTPPTELVESAQVTSADPYTVTYQLNQSAAWSDGTPIAAEDFSYLWQSMISTPGVVSPAGYQLIADVRSVNAGKTVEVVFSTPFPDWRTLFSPLLPARTLKGTPGGFATALQSVIPVAGGIYRMDSYDPVHRPGHADPQRQVLGVRSAPRTPPCSARAAPPT